jgi:type IV pilus assembly protein PilN
MFTPEINFLKERPNDQNIVATVPQFEESRAVGGIISGGVALGIGIVVAGISLGVFGWFNTIYSKQLAELEAEKGKIDTQVTQAQAKLKELQAQKVELDGIQARTNAFKAFFSTIQPWSAVLQDFRTRVPQDVWINSLTSVGKDVTIRGGSLSFRQVNDFILTLLQSPFVENVSLVNTSKVEGSGTNILESVSYEVIVTLKDLDLPSPDLREVLEARGSQGLSEKIAILRKLEEN